MSKKTLAPKRVTAARAKTARQPRQLRKAAEKAPAGLTSKFLLAQTLQSLEDDKAEAVMTIDLAGKSAMADHMVVASGRSTRHVGAIAEHLRDKLHKAGLKNVRVEGMPNCDWVLIDSGDIIVHVFRPEVREFYNLEKMWSADRPAERQAG